MAKPESLEVTYDQKQYQWRAMYESHGDWTSVSDSSSVSETFTRTGNVLHGIITYSPHVEEETGTSNVYVQNKKSGDWILREGKITYLYQPLYGPYTAVNYFRGYIRFDSSSIFEQGVLYQWIYVYEPQSEQVQNVIPYAVWDPVMNAWLVGFSIYLQDANPVSDEIGFPDPFPLPIPAKNYNPLDL